MNPPPVIPDHEPLRLIGHGSYGEVWLARNVLGTLRAVKVVRRADFDSPRPFEREFHGIQRFEPVSRSHDGLVDILQVGRNDPGGYFYYVMELADTAEREAQGPRSRVQGPESKVPGPRPGGASTLDLGHGTSDPDNYSPRTLASDLAARGRLPAAECVELFQALAEGLAHLHRAGLVHRDIKPANIIFVGGAAKFADIGLVSGADESGSFVGTEGFIPPEGSGRPAADIYSLGKVLYEAATGKDRKEFPALPLDAADLAAAAGLLELNAVIVKACANDPSQRHASAEELVADLALLRAGKSVKAQRQRERQREFGRRRLLPALAALFVLTGAGWWLRSAGRDGGKQTVVPAAPTPEQTAAELLAQARRLRGEAASGWRTAALDAIAKAAALRPSSELRQEAVFAFAAADLRLLPFNPPGPAAPLLLDLPRERYVTATPEGVILFRSLRDHSDLFRHDTDLEPVPQFLGFSASGRWLAMTGQGSSLRFRRCDPGTGAWVWLGRVHGVNHAAFNNEGTMVAYTFRLHAEADRFLALSPTADMGQKRFLELPGTTGLFVWSPSETKLAVLVEEPPQLAVVDIGLGTVTGRVPLDGKPTSLAWFGDARRVLCATRNGVWIADTVTGQVRPFAEGMAGTLSVALDEADRVLALAGLDGTVQLWDVAARRRLAAVSVPTERVELSPTGRQLVAYAPGRTRATLWEFANPRDVVRYLPPGDKALPAAADMPGLRLDSRGVWLEVGTNASFQLPAIGEVKGVARSANGAFLHVHLADGGVQEWNLPRLKERLATIGLGW